MSQPKGKIYVSNVVQNRANFAKRADPLDKFYVNLLFFTQAWVNFTLFLLRMYFHKRDIIRQVKIFGKRIKYERNL